MTMPTGGFVAISVTPLDEAGEVDYDDLGRLMQFYLDCGVDGVALLGVMGEANRMTDADARVVVEHAVNAIGGRVPIIVGVSDPSLERVVSLGEYSRGLGCAGVLLQPLAGLKGDRSVAGLFEAAGRALGPDIPICVQDFPKANDVHISVDAWEMILERCSTVVMLKLEDEPGLGKLSAIRSAEEKGAMRAVTIFTGNNGIHLVQELGRGSDGAMTGFAFPDVSCGSSSCSKTRSARRPRTFSISTCRSTAMSSARVSRYVRKSCGDGGRSALPPPGIRPIP